jgi:hypothetical protein
MKERGLEAGAMGVIEVELVQLEDVAALLATRFTDKSVLVKVIDAAGKCNLKAEQEVKCKTAATDLLKLNSWKIGVRPFLGKDRPLRIGCTFFFIAPGIARTIEWWHYQYQAGVTGKWSERMADIGWTNEGLRKVGYSEKQLGNAAK